MYNTAISEYEIQSTIENNFLLDFKKMYIRVFLFSFGLAGWCVRYISQQSTMNRISFIRNLLVLPQVHALHSSFTYFGVLSFVFRLHIIASVSLSFSLRCRLSLGDAVRVERGWNSNISNKQTWSEQKRAHSWKNEHRKKVDWVSAKKAITFWWIVYD